MGYICATINLKTDMAKVEDFFTLTNSVEGIDVEQYQHLEPMIRAIDKDTH